MGESPPTTATARSGLLEELAGALGERVSAAANRPIPLDDPGTAWFVERGGLDVYLVEHRQGKPASSWQHLLRVGESRLAFGVGGGDGGRLIAMAKGLPGTQLLRVRLKDTPRGDMGGELANTVDAWVAQFSAAVARKVEPRPRVSVLIDAGQSLDAGARSEVSAPPGGVVWVQAPDGAHYLGTEEPGSSGTGLVPLTSDAWLSLSQASRVSGFSAAALSRDGRLLPALREFHRLALAAEQFNRQLLLADEVNDQTGRAAYHTLAEQRARRSLFEILGSPRAADVRSDAALAGALEVIGRREKIAFRLPPRTRALGADDPSLGDILRASGVRARKVRLTPSDHWWWGDSGAMLAYQRDDGRPIALLPSVMGRYRKVDPASTKPAPVDAGMARQIDETAWCFYRPLPDDRPIRWRTLAQFAAENMMPDLVRLVVAGFLASVLVMAPAFLVGTLADWVLPSQDAGQLAQIVVIVGALAVVSGLMMLLRGAMLMRLEARVVSRVEAAVMDRLLDLPVGFFRRFTAGDLTSRMETFRRLRDQVSALVANALFGSLFVLPTLVLLFLVNDSLAWLSLCIGVLVLVSVGLLGLRMVAPQRRLYKATRSLAGQLLQFINGMSKLRAAGAEGSAFASWARGYREQLLARRQIDNLGKHMVALSAAAPGLAAAGLFAIASRQGPDQLTTGEFLVAYLVSLVFFTSIASLGLSLDAIATAVPLCEQIKPMLEAVPENRSEVSTTRELQGELRLDQVSFRYDPDGPVVLDDVSIEVRSGEFVAIIGESGSGKSTLMRIALGLEEPTGGTVYYDGNDVANLSGRSLRRQVGVVAQDDSLQPGNLLDNIIGLGDGLTVDDAWRAARLADVDSDIAAMPMQMLTVVGDSTATFSGGQMQRIKIAAALVRNPPIVFLDEATSWLDAGSQARVMQAIESLASTRVVIAHRLSTIRTADRIYVMKRGRIVQQGTFDGLYQADGVFRELVQRQMA